MKKALLVLALILLLALIGVFAFVPAQLEQSMNRVLHAPPYAASEKAKALHQQLFVADLHADSLLWNRNLLKRSTRGHVDIPRLIEGNVALQAFTIVSKTPRGQNIEANDDATDNITLLSIVELWPLRAWTSLKERALWQAQKLHDYAANSNGQFTLIKSKSELENYVARRQKEQGITAGFLGIEGAQVLEGNAANVDVMFDAGFRMMAPTHFFDNEIGGSAHGVNKAGLTTIGKEVIQRMEAKKMLVDIAHASSATIDDVLALATRPVMVSHTGVKGTCNNNRNLSDEQLVRIARTGGVIGIGHWDTAVCGTDANAVARAIRHAVNIAGINHIGLGSDFDGAVTEPFDTTGLVQVTDALLSEGFSEDEIKKIMGGNVLRVLREYLP
ncbi:MAG TPA: dipeptidase [Blastocatellia bacterium]|nr:dipeptidase [Blastocatellia bacterium]